MNENRIETFERERIAYYRDKLKKARQEVEDRTKKLKKKAKVTYEDLFWWESLSRHAETVKTDLLFWEKYALESENHELKLKIISLKAELQSRSLFNDNQPPVYLNDNVIQFPGERVTHMQIKADFTKAYNDAYSNLEGSSHLADVMPFPKNEKEGAQ